MDSSPLLWLRSHAHDESADWRSHLPVQPRQLIAHEWIDREIDNLRAALSRVGAED
jgi:hypothetical protein